MLYILKITLTTYLTIACLLFLVWLCQGLFSRAMRFRSFSHFQTFFILAVVAGILWPKLVLESVRNHKRSKNSG